MSCVVKKLLTLKLNSETKEILAKNYGMSLPYGNCELKKSLDEIIDKLNIK